MDLNTLYGPCRPAGGHGISQHERDLPSSSARILDATTRGALVEYMHIAERHPLGSLALSSMPILWVIDDDGNINFGFEEIVDSESGELLYSRQKGSPLPKEFARLGHPSLLKGERHARIGGEIFLDETPEGTIEWHLANESGRYGRREGQTEEHMKAAGRKFKEFDLSFRLIFNRRYVS